MQGGASGDGQERLPECLVREREGARRSHPAGQAPVGHRRTRRVRERERRPVVPGRTGLDFQLHRAWCRPRLLLVQKQSRLKHESTPKKNADVLLIFHERQFSASFHVAVSSTTHAPSVFAPRAQTAAAGARSPPPRHREALLGEVFGRGHFGCFFDPFGHGVARLPLSGVAAQRYHSAACDISSILNARRRVMAREATGAERSRPVARKSPPLFSEVRSPAGSSASSPPSLRRFCAHREDRTFSFFVKTTGKVCSPQALSICPPAKARGCSDTSINGGSKISSNI